MLEPVVKPGTTCAVALIMSCALLTGCGTLPDGGRWGEKITIAPGWERIGNAAATAARDPWVWVPLAAAAGLQIGNWDHQISTWAMRETPVFGSQANAASWSDTLRSVAVVADVSTVLLTPSGDDAGPWFADKARGYALDLVAATATISTTTLLKKATGRMRPNGVDDESFPSGHTSITAAYGRLAARNLEFIDISPGLRSSFVYGLDAVTFGTAWARIEAGAHYPSDTLFGIALGNFFANFFKDAFMGTQAGFVRNLSIEPARGGLGLQWHATF
jgi:membrane-associated phospholipid phosphatase